MTPSSEYKGEMTHIFFGGTFDPPHEGHRLVLERCLDAFPTAKVVVVPGAKPAGAFGQHKTPKASFEQRVEMCSLGFLEKIASERLSISTIERDLEAPNYTWKTLEALKASAPGSFWGILLGFDQLQSFAGWQNSRELVEKYNVVAVERPSYETLPVILPKLSETFAAIDSLGSGVYRLGRSSQKLYTLMGAVSDAASRVVRTSIDQVQTRAWLDPNVTDYIRQHKLYDESEA